MRVGTSPLPGRSLSFIIGQLSPPCDPSVINEVNAVSSILLQDGVRDLVKGERPCGLPVQVQHIGFVLGQDLEGTLYRIVRS